LIEWSTKIPIGIPTLKTFTSFYFGSNINTDMSQSVVILSSEQFEMLEKKIELILNEVQSKTKEVQKDWISAQETMELLNIGQTTLWSYRKQGKIKARKINKKLYFSVQEVESLIENS
jgi:hypothetical protein